MKKKQKQTIYILDKKDKKILYYLEQNSRQSNSQIAKKVGLSKQAVGNRIKKLEEVGILNGFWTIVDYQKLGFTCYNILLKLKNMDPEKEKEFITYLSNVKGISWIAQTMGKWDLIIAFLYKDLPDFNEIFIKVCDKYNENIQTYEILPNLDNYPINCKLLYKDLKKTKISTLICGINQKVKINKNDIKILKLLTNDARIPLIKLSRKLNLTPKTLKNRINYLMKTKVIQSFRPEINYNKLGYQWRICFFEVKNFKIQEKERFINYAKSHLNITYIVNTIGHYINIDILAKNEEELLMIKNEFHKEFNNFIKGSEIVNVLKIHKRDFLPINLEETC